MIWRSHGANPEKLYDQLGIKMPERIIDFSTNTNVKKNDADYNFDIKKIISEYPDDESVELRHKLAIMNKASFENFIVVNGTNSAIYMIVEQYKKIAILQPTYSEYARAVNNIGKELINIFSPDEIPDDADLFIICNPNNPTGEYIDKGKLEKIIYKCKNNDTDVLVDEAYIDFLPYEHEMINRNMLGNVYIMRSMTKVYHLSGIRLGYVISSPEKIRKLKDRQPTWSVNSLAQTIGMMFLEGEKFITDTKKYYREETKRFKNAIKNLGFKVLPSAVHFFLMEVNDDEKFIRYMMKKGIVIRHTRNFMGLNGRYVRICTREKRNNDIFIEALGKYKATTS